MPRIQTHLVAGLGTLLLVSLVAGQAGAEEPVVEIDWKPDEVARVAGEPVSWDDLCRAAVEHLSPQLDDRRSAASASYATLLFDVVIDRLSEEHGIDIPEAAREKAWAGLDARAREERGKGLEALMRERLLPRRTQERDVLRALKVEALQAKGVDLGAAWAKADVRRALATAANPDPTELPAGVVATVDGVEVTEVQYGDRLLSFAGPKGVAEIVERACRRKLAETVGAELDDEVLEAELAFLAKLAPLEARFDPEEVWQQFTVRDGEAREASYTEERVRASPFARALLGLVRRFRGELTEGEVVGAWRSNATSLWGPHVLVTGVAVEFDTAGDVFAAGSGRSRAEAREIAKAARSLLAEGLAREQIAEQVDAGDAPGVEVRQLRVYRTDRNRLIWERVSLWKDDQTGPLVETLDAFHALRRERLVPAPHFLQVEPLVRERMARARARSWLEEKLADPEVIRRRWPLPQLR